MNTEEVMRKTLELARSQLNNYKSLSRPIAYLEYSLTVDCPNCEEIFDLVDTDDHSSISDRIFNNAWDKLSGYEVTCPKCQQLFKLDKVEY